MFQVDDELILGGFTEVEERGLAQQTAGMASKVLMWHKSNEWTKIFRDQ